MGGGGGSGRFGNTQGASIKLKANTKSDALNLVKSLSNTIQKSAKDFFKGGSNKYYSFSVEQKSNGNIIIKMEKPGNVPGSKAIYYKEVSLMVIPLEFTKKHMGLMVSLFTLKKSR